MGLAVVAHGLSCSVTCGILLDQGSTPCPCIGSWTQTLDRQQPLLSRLVLPPLSTLWVPLLCSCHLCWLLGSPPEGKFLLICVYSVSSRCPFWDDSLILHVLPVWIYFYVIRRHYCFENSVCFTLRFSANVISDVASLPVAMFSTLWKWSEVKVSQLCPTLCDPMDCSLPGFSVRGILQARTLEWVAMPFSRGSSWPRDQTQVSRIAGRFFTVWATWEAPSLWTDIKYWKLKKKKYWRLSFSFQNLLVVLIKKKENILSFCVIFWVTSLRPSSNEWILSSTRKSPRFILSWHFYFSDHKFNFFRLNWSFFIASYSFLTSSCLLGPYTFLMDMLASIFFSNALQFKIFDISIKSFSYWSTFVFKLFICWLSFLALCFSTYFEKSFSLLFLRGF